MLREWYYVSVLRLLIAECRSLPFRMARSVEIRAWWRRAVPGSIPREIAPFSVDGCRSCRDAYSLDMRRLEVDYPFLSTLDLLVATRMYLAGVRQAPCTCYRDRIPDQSRSLVHRDGGNSMPPVVVQQSSECDPPNPPPSQALP